MRGYDKIKRRKMSPFSFNKVKIPVGAIIDLGSVERCSEIYSKCRSRNPLEFYINNNETDNTRYDNFIKEFPKFSNLPYTKVYTLSN